MSEEILRITVYVKPRSSRSAVLGMKDDRLEIAVSAPPVDGAANAEVCKVLADYFGVPKSRVEVIHGASSKVKHVTVRGGDPARLNPPPQADR